MLAYRRIDRVGNEVIVVINFTPVVREDYPVAVPSEGIYEELLNSDDESFGGSGVVNLGDLHTLEKKPNEEMTSLLLRIPPLGMTVLRCKEKKQKTEKNDQVEHEAVF